MEPRARTLLGVLFYGGTITLAQTCNAAFAALLSLRRRTIWRLMFYRLVDGVKTGPAPALRVRPVPSSGKKRPRAGGRGAGRRFLRGTGGRASLPKVKLAHGKHLHQSFFIIKQRVLV
jgi:hypothetical protein